MNLDDMVSGKRLLREALTDVRDSYRRCPTSELARMIQQLEAEIAIRRRLPKAQKL